MASNNEYEIALIENEIDACLCAKLIAEEFATRNPLTICNQTTAEQSYDRWVWPFMMDVLDEKLSFFIRHRPTNEIVASMIASDLFSYNERYPYDASSPASHYPTSDLFDEMVDQFVHHDFDHELKPNTVLYIIAVATQSKHSKKNLAAQLSTCACHHAQVTKGFQYAFVQTCNSATRHIYVKKMNGKELAVLHPTTWVWKKNGDGLSCPLQDYKDEPIVNILVNLTQ
ncbi:unnamed protein product [Rotaria sp. Silwood1]|nr:unnamed protein product [Rotaria sp. Silwood1]CAF3698214.1 unnamed protein product [Rotaria sp. Silwood1]CAF4634200.1 unnamed protein product [Rotaria sp. Silwood1]